MKGKLSREEILRYSRHLIIPEVGVRGKERLKDASVLCVAVSMGGLTTWIRIYPNINDHAHPLENRHENLPIQRARPCKIC